MRNWNYYKWRVIRFILRLDKHDDVEEYLDSGQVNPKYRGKELINENKLFKIRVEYDHKRVPNPYVNKIYFKPLNIKL